ncbi:MAG TPA: acyl-CoA dehydrogenase family protein [Syntrophomonas sp.]|nr:acyl-CoA dehydrogenase family protein [Syntrophomonas sp.]
MSYFITEEQQLILNAVRDFCNDPKIQQMNMEAMQQGKVARAVWDAAAELGFVGISTPEKYGGGGRDLFTECLVIEELAKAGNPFGTMLIAHNLGLKCLYYCGTEEQKMKYLVPMASGKALCASAFTDPAGSFNFKEWGVTFVKQGDEYVVNGGKVMVTHADEGDIKFIFAMDYEKDSVMKGLILEKGMPGIECGKQTKLMPSNDGWGRINLKNVKIPSENIVDTGNSRIPYLAPGFLEVGLAGLAMSEVAFALAMNYAGQRTRYGKPLTVLQKVTHHLVDMAILKETSRSLVYNAAQLWDAERYDEAERLCLMAKIYCTECATKITHDAAMLFGGIGYTPEAIVGPLHIGAFSLEIAEGTNDILRDFVGETYGIKPGWKNGLA